MRAVSAAPPGTSIVLTKVRAPSARDLVPRPSLVARLAGGPPRRVTLVRAPAGWGKTTLLSAWASSPAEARPFAWLSIEPVDADPGRFWTYVLEALRTQDPGLDPGLGRLFKAPGVDLREGALPALVNAIAERDRPMVLVLDDLHAVDDAVLHASLGWFVEHLPTVLELAVATRTAPRLPLGRLRAHGDLLEVDETHLRFSAHEAGTLLNDVVKLGLSERELGALHRRTEGWAAGLYLAALSLRDREDRGAFIDAFSGDDRHVVDYLGSEVLAGVDEELREFLLRTSVLERLTGPACDAVMDAGGSAAVLRDIERTNLLLVALDDRRAVYRYHHLFADLLRHELEVVRPGLAPRLHRRASRHFLAEGDEDRAIRHAIAAGDIADAVSLIAEHWPAALLTRGDHHGIDRWLVGVGDPVIARDPRLCVARAFTFHSLGRAFDATRWITRAEALLTDDTSARIRGDVAAARASNALQTGDVALALPAAERALEVGDPGSPWTPIPHGVRGHGRRWSGDAEGALEGFTGWLRESEARGQVLGVVCSHAEIALLRAEDGRAADARQAARLALDAAGGAFAEHWVATGAHVALAAVAAAEGDAEEARDAAARAVALARRGGPPGARANALLAAAEQAPRAEARALVQEAAAILAPCPDPGAMVRERCAAALARHDAGARGRAPAEPEPGDELSERELVVLRMLAGDLSQREIGAELFVSLNTVKTHSRRIYRKLGARGREDAVLRARETGLLR